VEQLKKQFSGRQKSQSPEVNTTSSKSTTSTVNVVTNQVQGDPSIIARLSAAVAQQVNVEAECKTSLRFLCVCVYEKSHNSGSDHFSLMLMK
jgi:hypothetical protein